MKELFRIFSEVFGAFMEFDTHSHDGVPFKKRFRLRKYQILMAIVVAVILFNFLLYLYHEFVA